jgi:hypothetical protein
MRALRAKNGLTVKVKNGKMNAAAPFVVGYHANH